MNRSTLTTSVLTTRFSRRRDACATEARRRRDACATGARRRQDARGTRAAILLEVLLSLAIFVGGASVVLASLHSSLKTVRDLRLQARAADLAVTVLSHVQMGLIAVGDEGPTDFDTEEDPSLEGWTWQIVTTTFEDDLLDETELTQVLVIIANEEEDYAYSLARLMPASEEGLDETDDFDDSSSFDETGDFNDSAASDTAGRGGPR